MYIDYIRHHIFALAPDQIFTTRDLLVYARRNTVDKCLSKLVKDGSIRRLARGVFVRDFSDNVTPLAVAKAKLEAFGKRLIDHQCNVDARILANEQLADPLQYRTDGKSSSFASVFGRIEVFNCAPRIHKLADTRHGEVISYVWDKVRKGESFNEAHRGLPFLNRFDLQDLRTNIRWMPQWLGDKHIYRPVPPLILDQLYRQTCGHSSAPFRWKTAS